MRQTTKITRIRILGSVWILILCLGLSPLLLGQQSSAKASSSESSPSQAHPWSEGPAGVKYVYVTVPPPLKYQPEFLILQLKPEAYKKFKTNPKEFLNSLHKEFKVLRAPIRELSTCRPAESKAGASKTDPPPDETYYYVIVTHWPGSRATYEVYETGGPPSQ